MVKWGRISGKSDDSEIDQIYQVSTIGGKPKPGTAVMPYGMSANVPVDCTALMVSPGGSGQDEAFIPSMPENRFNGLKEWCVKVGNFLTRANTHYNSDGDIELNPQGTVKAEDWAVQYSALVERLDALQDAFNGHIHLGSTATGGLTCSIVAPSSTVPPESSNEDFTAIKSEKVRLP